MATFISYSYTHTFSLRATGIFKIFLEDYV